MESLRNEPVILTGNSPIGGGNDNSALFSLLGRPSVVDIGTLFNEKSASDTRRDVKDSESEIKDSIHLQTMGSSNEFRALGYKLNSIDKEALSSRYEAQIASKDSTVALSNKFDCESNQLRNQIGHFATSVDKQFTSLNYEMFKSLSAIRERELIDQNQDLRRALDRQREENQTNEIVSKLLSVLKPGAHV